MSPELLAELQRHTGAVRGELALADEAYRRAARWQQWTEQSDQAVPRLKIIVPLTGALMGLVGVAIPLSQRLGMAPELVRVVVTPLLVVPGLFLIGYLIWQYSGARPARRRAVAGRVAVACPNCGATNELAAEAPTQACAFCRTALIASPLVMQRGMDAAEYAYRRARLEEFRQERLGAVGLSRYDMTPYVPFIVVGSILVPLGSATSVFTAQMLRREQPLSPEILLLWGMSLGTVAILAATLLYRRSRRMRYAAALSDLGRQFPLHPLASSAEIVDWLNRCWPATYEVTALTTGPYFVAASLDALGYPALLNGDFTTGENREPRLHLLLAGSAPRAAFSTASDPAMVRAAVARCHEFGFSVSQTEAGLLAVAGEDLLRILRRSPAALHLIAPVFGALASAAHASGTVPAVAQ